VSAQVAHAKRKKEEAEAARARRASQPNSAQLQALLAEIPDDGGEVAVSGTVSPRRRRAGSGPGGAGEDADNDVRREEDEDEDEEDEDEDEENEDGMPPPLQGGYLGDTELPTQDAGVSMQSWQDWGEVVPQKRAVSGPLEVLGIPLGSEQEVRMHGGECMRACMLAGRSIHTPPPHTPAPAGASGIGGEPQASGERHANVYAGCSEGHTQEHRQWWPAGGL
jgi:hypothetical protein